MKRIVVFIGITLSFVWPANQASNPTPALAQAQAFLEAEDYTKALVLFEQYLYQDPLATRAWNGLRYCRQKLGQWTPPTTSSPWEKQDLNWETISSDSMANAYHQAQEWYDQGDYPRCSPLAYKLMMLHPHDTLYADLYQRSRIAQQDTRNRLVRVGNEFHYRGQLRLAAQEFAKAQYFAPQDYYISTRLNEIREEIQWEHTFYEKQISVANEKGDSAKYWQWIDQALQAFPYDIRFQALSDQVQPTRTKIMHTQIEQGQRLFYGRNYLEAKNWFEHLAQNHPDNPQVRHWLHLTNEQVYLQNRDHIYDSLRVSLQKQLEQQAYVQAALTLQNIQQFHTDDQDIVSPRDSLLLTTQVQIQQYFLEIMGKARRLATAHQYKNALGLVEKALTIIPTDSNANALAQKIRNAQKAHYQNLRARVERIEELVQQKRWLEILPEDLIATGDPNLDKRLAAIQEQLNSVPKTETDSLLAKGASLFDQGLLYYRAGDYARALKLWKETLLYDPRHPKAQDYIDNVEKKMQ